MQHFNFSRFQHFKISRFRYTQKTSQDSTLNSRFNIEVTFRYPYPSEACMPLEGAAGSWGACRPLQPPPASHPCKPPPGGPCEAASPLAPLGRHQRGLGGLEPLPPIPEAPVSTPAQAPGGRGGHSEACMPLEGAAGSCGACRPLQPPPLQADWGKRKVTSRLKS